LLHNKIFDFNSEALACMLLVSYAPTKGAYCSTLLIEDFKRACKDKKKEALDCNPLLDKNVVFVRRSISYHDCHPLLDKNVVFVRRSISDHARAVSFL